MTEQKETHLLAFEGPQAKSATRGMCTQFCARPMLDVRIVIVHPSTAANATLLEMRIGTRSLLANTGTVGMPIAEALRVLVGRSLKPNGVDLFVLLRAERDVPFFSFGIYVEPEGGE
jgi:hypothetical protein